MNKGVIAAATLFALLLIAFLITMLIYEIKILHQSTRAANSSESLNVIAQEAVTDIQKTTTIIKQDVAKLVAIIEEFLHHLEG